LCTKVSPPPWSGALLLMSRRTAKREDDAASALGSMAGKQADGTGFDETLFATVYAHKVTVREKKDIVCFF